MNSRPSFVAASFLLSAGSIALAVVSVALSQRVYYLDYLSFFNAMAAAMLLLGVAGLVAGLVGLWRARGRNAVSWLAPIAALAVIMLYLFDS